MLNFFKSKKKNQTVQFNKKDLESGMTKNNIIKFNILYKFHKI